MFVVLYFSQTSCSYFPCRTALNDTLMAIDFTSLLESKYLPKQGEQSISLYLKQKVPVGSLAYDKWEAPPRNMQKEEDEELVAKGWRMESLSSAADSLLSAATRLEQDVKKETTYWAQVLGVEQKGWTVFKDPIEKQNLGVQIGSRESGVLFKARGIVTLKADDEGMVSLGQSTKTEPQTLRVRVSRNGKIVGSSRTLPTRVGPESHSPLEKLVHDARDSLFEEELFHEITLETRTMLALGVKHRKHTVHIPAVPHAEASGTAEEILVDLVPSNEVPGAAEDTTSDELAQSLALALRLLLSHLHRIRLRRRTALPLPLQEDKRLDPPSSILSPLMMALQHQYAVWRLTSSLQSVIAALKGAGFPVALDMDHASTSSKAPSSAIADPFSSAITSKISFRLPSSSISPKESSTSGGPPMPTHKILLDIVTQFSPPTSGTEYTLTIPPPLTRILYPRAQPRPRGLMFPSDESLMAQIYELISLDITTNILAARYPQWKPSLSPPSLACMINMEGKIKKADISVDVALISEANVDEKSSADHSRMSTAVSITVLGRFTTDPQVLSSDRWVETDGVDKEGLVEVADGWIKSWTEGKEEKA